MSLHCRRCVALLANTRTVRIRPIRFNVDTKGKHHVEQVESGVDLMLLAFDLVCCCT